MLVWVKDRRLLLCIGFFIKNICCAAFIYNLLQPEFETTKERHFLLLYHFLNDFRFPLMQCHFILSISSWLRFYSPIFQRYCRHWCRVIDITAHNWQLSYTNGLNINGFCSSQMTNNLKLDGFIAPKYLWLFDYDYDSSTIWLWLFINFFRSMARIGNSRTVSES